MAVFGRNRPCADWSSHRRSRSCAGEVCWRLPRAAGSLLVYDFASTSCVPVMPLRAGPSPSSGGRSLVGLVVGGFSSHHPRPRPSSPRRAWDAVGAPRVSTPLGGPSSMEVKSSHDDSTPPPFVCGVESSCHDSTPPPLLLGVELSLDDSTPPALSMVGRVVRRRFDPPPTPWRPLPEYFSTPEASWSPSFLSTPWGLGLTPEFLRPPEFPPTPQVSAPSHPWRPLVSPPSSGH